MRSHYRVRIQRGGVGALDVFTDSGDNEIEINWCQYQEWKREIKKEKLSKTKQPTQT